MSEQKHTPTPWKIAETSLTIKAECNGITIADVRGHDTRFRGKDRMEAIEYCKGNASLIVRAVNSHDKLVAALSKIAVNAQAAVDGGDALAWIDELHDIARDCREALAAAEAQ